jgi:glyoxylate/hydroxypyruvate reductase A
MTDPVLLAIRGWPIEPWLARFRRLLPDRPIVTPEDDFDRAAVRFAAVWKPAPGLLATLPNLRAILSLGAGVDPLMADPTLPDAPIVRVVDPDLTARMSEYVVMHCLMQLRAVEALRRAQAERRWADEIEPPPARAVTVGVMGLGVLGRDIASKLLAMGFQVVGWSRGGGRIERVPTHAGEAGLAPFLAATDILVAVMPLTPQTRGMLSRPLFEGLRRNGPLGGPVLINVGRGGLQVEADILAALDEGLLRAAVIDVFETEPLPKASPLWAHPRLTITPHNSAPSDPEAIAAYAVRQLKRIEAGLFPENTVDRARGY